MTERTWAGLALSAALLTVLALPAPAGALTAKYERSTGLFITAAAGERNRVEAGFFGEPPPGDLPSEYGVIERSNAPVVPGGGCKPDGPNAKCNITGIRALSVDLGDGVENSFRYFGTGDVKITAKGGIDEIRTNSGFDLIDSGGGNDILPARPAGLP